MNFGHGALGFGAWPSAKSKPVAEYCTVFSASTPSALAALPTTAAASCADGVVDATAISAISVSTATRFFSIKHRLSCRTDCMPAPQDRIRIGPDDGIQAPTTRQEVAAAVDGIEGVRGGRRRG